MARNNLRPFPFAWHSWVQDAGLIGVQADKVDNRQLVEHAVLTFDPKKVFAFLGSKYCEHYKGESHICRLQRRVLDVCMRHDVGSNGIKMYDKGSRLHRIETSLYQPKPFRVLRTRKRRDGSSSRGYHPLCRVSAICIIINAWLELAISDTTKHWRS